MSTEKIWGGWDTPPNNGYSDEITDSWHWLAAQNVGKPNFEPNSGLSQRRAELSMLLDLYRRARPKIVCEIGTAQGGSLGAFCFHGRPDALIICIDRCVDDCRPRAGEQVSPRIVHRQVNQMTSGGGGAFALARNNQVMYPINGWSHEDHVLNTIEKVLAGRKIDWLFNDGSHSAEMAQKDFDLYWPMIASGGVYASHDVMPSAVPACNKSVWWESTRERDDYSMRMEFFSARNLDSMGIGVLVKA